MRVTLLTLALGVTPGLFSGSAVAQGPFRVANTIEHVRIGNDFEPFLPIDLDGDGIDDLIDQDTVRIAWNDGLGRFSEPVSIPGSSVSQFGARSTNDFAVADFNGDGLLDLLRRGDVALDLVLGRSDRALLPALVVAGVNLTAILAADVDGNGVPDLVGLQNGTTPQTDSLVVLPNLGGGTFGAPTVVGQLPKNSVLFRARINGDARDDIYSAANFSEVRAITFTALSQATITDLAPVLAGGPLGGIQPGDFDNDGDDDLSLGTVAPRILENLGGSFALRAPLPSPTPTGGTQHAIVDLNGDGLLDIASGSVFGSVYWRNLGGLQFAPAQFFGPADQNRLSLLVGARFDQDANGDLLARLPGTGRLWLGQPSGSPVRATEPWYQVDTEGSFQFGVPGDFDGDGRTDLVLVGGPFGPTPDVPQLLLRSAAGVATRMALGGTVGQVRTNFAIAAIDLDRDGRAELLHCNRAAELRVRTLANPLDQSIVIPSEANGISEFDANRDGFPDVLLDSPQGTLFLLLNDGTGHLVVPTSPLPIPFSNNPRSVIDVDADGDDDIVVGPVFVSGGRNLEVYINDGTGAFSTGPVSFLPAQPVGASTGSSVVDFDGDADLDLWLPSFNQFAVNDGQGGFTFQPVNLGVSALQGSIAADFDLDGDIDLVGSSPPLFEPTFLENDGTGVFTPTALTRSNRRPEVIAVADLDDDGDLDLIGEPFLANTTRDIESRFVPRLGQATTVDLRFAEGAGSPSFATLFAAPQASPFTQPILNGGIEIANPIPVSTGVLDSTGHRSITVSVPGTASLVGVEVYFQGFGFIPASSTGVLTSSIVDVIRF